MATSEFAYVESKGRFYPIIPIHIKYADMEKDAEALIDSGAVISTFKPEFADYLGINIEDGEKRNTIGISGKLEVFIHNLELKIFDQWFYCKVAFSRNLKSNFNLLGREDFFERHLITFNEKDKKTIIGEF